MDRRDVPTVEAHPAEAPDANDQPDAGDMEPVSNDVEMDFVGHVGATQGIGSLEPSFDDEVSDLLLAEMGSSGRVRRRDGRKAMRKMVS